MLKDILKKGIKAKHPKAIITEGFAAGHITEEQKDFLETALKRAEDAIQVDEFELNDFVSNRCPTALT